MRLSRLAFPAALALAAAAALAQDETPPANGLSDLGETLGQLEDAPAQDAPPAETSAPEPAPAEPAAEAPAPEPAPAEMAPAAETPPPAQSPRPAEPLTREQIQALAAAGQRGAQLIAIARAGIIGTQDMLSRVSDPEGAGIAGWIAEPEGNATEVIFYAHGADGGAPVAVYRANIMGPRVVSRDVFLAPGERPTLNPIEARMAAAHDATESLDHRPCGGDTFNVLVVPPASASAPVDVYQMSPATRPGRFPLGGHFKSTVAADGSVTETRGFTNACVDLNAPATPQGQRPRPLAVTHLLDPLPTEIHAYLSLWTGRPLVVVAGDPQRLFLVAGDRIAEIRERPADTQ